MLTRNPQLVHIDNLPALNPHSIEAQIGNTPLIDLSHIAQRHGVGSEVQLFAKAEWFNPTGSVKDRAALNIIRTAEHEGKLRPGMTLLDSTSGNMGISYAMIGAARGYKVKLVLPSNVSQERLKILRSYGAELVLTDPIEGLDGAMKKAQSMASSDATLYYADQYNNPANWQAHYWTTGAEIWQQTNGQLTHFVAGLGTSGTFTGTTRRLKTFNPDIVAIAAQPDKPFHGLEGWKYMPTAILPGIYDHLLADEHFATATEPANAMAKELAKTAGLFISPSAAGSVHSAIEIAKRLDKGIVVTVMVDSAYKYLNERFWAD